MKKQKTTIPKHRKLFSVLKAALEKLFLVFVAFALVYMFVKSLHDEEATIQAPKAVVEVDTSFIDNENTPITLIEYDYDTNALDQIIAKIDSGVSFDLCEPQNGHFEEIYELYEEELPTNVIDTGRKKVKKAVIETPTTPVYSGKTPVIAIVIDDMGISKHRTKNINSLHAPITSSFLPYAQNLDEQIEDSKASGHEVIAHIPMEAKSKRDVAP